MVHLKISYFINAGVFSPHGYCILKKFCFEERIFLRQNQISEKGGGGGGYHMQDKAIPGIFMFKQNLH